jgi:hypothetical protein
MSVTALHLYQKLTEATDDKTRAQVIAEAFSELEERYPNLKDVATGGQVRETELRLQKEIKEVDGRLQKEIKEVEGRLQKEIEGVRLEIRGVEGRLQKEIECVRLEIKEVEIRLTQAMHRQTLWVIGSVGTIIGLIRLLDWVLARIPHPM